MNHSGPRSSSTRFVRTPATEIARIAELWRYPVKSMRGEPCTTLTLDPTGVAGDRRFAITSSRAPVGKPLLASDERSAMLLYQPHLAPDGTVTVATPDGRIVDLHDPALLRHIASTLPTPTHLDLLASPRPLTDVRPIALHSLQTAAALARDLPHPNQANPRRLRSNLILDLNSDLSFAEDTLAGQTLLIGPTARILIRERIPRCRIVALDPETAAPDRTLLTHLARHHNARAGIYATVLTPGPIHLNDPVFLVPQAG